jgi:hypothetical protein
MYRNQDNTMGQKYTHNGTNAEEPYMEGEPEGNKTRSTE